MLNPRERSAVLSASLINNASAPKYNSVSSNNSGNIFTQYSASRSATKTEPDVLESAVNGTVTIVNEVADNVMKIGEGALNVVDAVLDGVATTVKGTVKAVVDTVDNILEDEPEKSKSARASQVSQAGGAKRRSKKSTKSSRKGSKKSSRKGSKKSSRKGSKRMSGGGKKRSKKSSKKASKKSSKKGSKKSSRKASKKLSGGGANAGFEAFLKLKKSVAELLGISNGPAAGKAAGAAQKEVKSNNPDLDSVKVSEEALKLVKANPSKYKAIAENK